MSSLNAPALRAVGLLDPTTYTVDQLAVLAQSSARNLWRLIDQKKLKGVVRIGRLVRISKSAADAWLAGQKGGA